MLYEDPYFGGEPAAGRPERKDRHGSFERRQKTYSGALSQFGGEEPGWRLGYAKMLQHTHPHLFDITRSKESCWNDTLGTKRPRLHRPTLDKHHGPVTGEIVRGFRRAVPCEVLRCGDENDYRLSEISGDQTSITVLKTNNLM